MAPVLNLKVNCTANQAILKSSRRPAMSDDAVDYSGTTVTGSDSDSDLE